MGLLKGQYKMKKHEFRQCDACRKFTTDDVTIKNLKYGNISEFFELCDSCYFDYLHDLSHKNTQIERGCDS